MPIKSRITDVTVARRWDQDLPLHYLYTLGVAGQKFSDGLKQGKIIASKCSGCSSVYLPPKAYCTKCHSKIEKYVSAPSVGVVEAVTGAGKSKYCYVAFKGITGGLVHRLLSPAGAGAKVKPVFAQPKDRQGRITDILGFST